MSGGAGEERGPCGAETPNFLVDGREQAAIYGHLYVIRDILLKYERHPCKLRTVARLRENGITADILEGPRAGEAVTVLKQAFGVKREGLDALLNGLVYRLASGDTSRESGKADAVWAVVGLVDQQGSARSVLLRIPPASVASFFQMVRRLTCSIRPRG